MKKICLWLPNSKILKKMGFIPSFGALIFDSHCHFFFTQNTILSVFVNNVLFFPFYLQHQHITHAFTLVQFIARIWPIPFFWYSFFISSSNPPFSPRSTALIVFP